MSPWLEDGYHSLSQDWVRAAQVGASSSPWRRPGSSALEGCGLGGRMVVLWDCACDHAQKPERSCRRWCKCPSRNVSHYHSDMWLLCIRYRHIFLSQHAWSRGYLIGVQSCRAAELLAASRTYLRHAELLLRRAPGRRADGAQARCEAATPEGAEHLGWQGVHESRVHRDRWWSDGLQGRPRDVAVQEDAHVDLKHKSVFTLKIM